jgi:hypothetical protein
LDLTNREMQLIKCALINYANARHEFAQHMSQDGYRKRDGGKANIKDVESAIEIAGECDDLLGKFL